MVNEVLGGDEAHSAAAASVVYEADPDEELHAADEAHHVVDEVLAVVKSIPQQPQ